MNEIINQGEGKVKGNLLNKFFYFIGLDDSEEDSEKLETENTYFLNRKAEEKINRGKVINFNSKKNMRVILREPSRYEDVLEISENLKNDKPVIINLKNMDKDNAKRLIDFLSGVIYAIDGNIKKIENGIFLVVPANIDISGDFSYRSVEENIFPWDNGN